MLRWLPLFALLLAAAPAEAQIIGGDVLDVGKVASGGGCSAATTFLARTSTFSGALQTAITTFICNEVTAGNWAKFDAFYLAGGTADDGLNWVSTSFSPLTFNSITHGSALGWTGTGSSYIDTGIIPLSNTAQYTKNSASIGTCVVNSRTTGSAVRDFGVNDTYTTQLAPRSGANAVTWEVNSSGGPESTANTNAQGAWHLLRTGSTAEAVYLNGSSFATASAGTSSTAFTHSVYLLAYNSGGSAIDNSTDKIAYFFVGSGSINETTLYSDLHALWAAFGGSGC